MARWPFDFRSPGPAGRAAADFYLAPQSRPRPVDRGLGRLGRPEPAVPALPARQRRAIGRRPQADPAEGALVPVPPPDMPHRGPVVALVVADLDLAPAAVPHRLPPCACGLRPRLPAGRGPDPATAARRHQPPTARYPAATVAVRAATRAERGRDARRRRPVFRVSRLSQPVFSLLSVLHSLK